MKWSVPVSGSDRTGLNTQMAARESDGASRYPPSRHSAGLISGLPESPEMALPYRRSRRYEMGIPQVGGL